MTAISMQLTKPQNHKYYMSLTVFQASPGLMYKNFQGLTRCIRQVGGELFRIPTGCIQGKSDVFMFSSRKEENDDDNPTVLPDDFERFLDILLQFGPDTSQEFSTEHWLSALKLATMWDIPDLRALAIEKLSTVDMEVMGRLRHGRRYMVKDWVLECYEKLVRREKHLDEREVENLGIGVATRICKLREEFIASLARKWFIPSKAGQLDICLQFEKEVREEMNQSRMRLTKD